MKEGEFEKRFSFPQESINELTEGLGEIEEGIIELKSILDEGEIILKGIIDDNKAFRERGMDEFSAEEVESIKKNNEKIKKLIAELEEKRGEYEAVIYSLKETDKKIDEFFESKEAKIKQ